MAWSQKQISWKSASLRDSNRLLSYSFLLVLDYSLLPLIFAGNKREPLQKLLSIRLWNCGAMLSRALTAACQVRPGCMSCPSSDGSPDSQRHQKKTLGSRCHPLNSPHRKPHYPSSRVSKFWHPFVQYPVFVRLHVTSAQCLWPGRWTSQIAPSRLSCFRPCECYDLQPHPPDSQHPGP